MSVSSTQEKSLTLISPLSAAWQEQHVTLCIPGLDVGEPALLLLDGVETPFQYTGAQDACGAEVMVRLGFARDQRRTLAFVPAERCSTQLTPHAIPLDGPVAIGRTGNQLVLDIAARQHPVGGPLGRIGDFPLASHILTEHALESVTLTCTNQGPLFDEYQLCYRFAERGWYTVRYRCYQAESYIEVAEKFHLGMGARLTAEWNPAGTFSHIVSHGTYDFESDCPPTVEPLGKPRPKDVLCRLQMPVLGEYSVPNNRGWFAFYHDEQRERGMLGLLGLYGDRWKAPVDNIMHFADVGGQVTMTAALEDGERYWLLVTAPVETELSPDNFYRFHRLHGEFNALRLDDNLDLSGEVLYDAETWAQPGFLGEDWAHTARANLAHFPHMQQAAKGGSQFLAALDLPVEGVTHEEACAALREQLFSRFERWVAQFQGYRANKHDYAKNVIGFSRTLRWLMISYELLRKQEMLSETDLRRLSAYFVFAARRIMDAGRWPHDKTTLYPLHPDSTRGFYAYPSEHVPDKLYWTNCLPNFQSDPLSALMQLASLFPEHPDAQAWLRTGLDDLEAQLDHYCGKSGAWEENINYALFTFSYFLVTFRLLKHRFGINYFQDPRVRAFVGWLTRYLGPYDRRFDTVTWPVIGNGTYPTIDTALLLSYAGELEEGDPLRDACIAAHQAMEPKACINESWLPLLALTAPRINKRYMLPPLSSEYMDEMGVAMRHNHLQEKESYLFQKIGLWKDHYEGDETAFNWHAKGTPLAMDYGVYAVECMSWAMHNLVEIPDADTLRRGFLGDHYFSELVDYTRCEVPVSFKLQWGKVRSFAEIDGPPTPPLFNYIGDECPTGPKVWKKRLLLFVKPDYLLLFDRVIGAVPHRFNLHAVSEAITRQGNVLHCQGRYDLDLRCYVQHPQAFRYETGELLPQQHNYTDRESNPYRQQFFRLYNDEDGIYRTVLFAQERERQVRIEPCGATGVKIITPEYVDYAFAADEPVDEGHGDVHFVGRVGWIRRETDGTIRAAVPDGDLLQAFGLTITGRGPWHYNADGTGQVQYSGVPRIIHMQRA